jgi:ribonuclease HII
MRVAGLDEAGRGPVLGSLVVGCVIYDEIKLPHLEEIGVDDSKKLSPKRRDTLVSQIKEQAISTLVKEVTAEQISESPHKGINLNQLEVITFAQALNEIQPKPDIIYIDACDTNETRFGEEIGKLLNFTPKQIVSKHKGDSLFKIVGAASILAKTTRDQIIETFKTKYGEIGSGYPSDPYTKTFLDSYYKEHRTFPPIVRTWWSTAVNIVQKYAAVPEKREKNTKQKKLFE